MSTAVDIGLPPLERWGGRALCGDADGELWFADAGTADRDQARRICRRCDAQQECLDWAIATRQRWGIWGGLDPEQRAQVRRQRQQTAEQHPLAAAVRGHAEGGTPDPEIADLLGCSRWTVRRIRKALGITRDSGRPPGTGRPWTDADHATLLRLVATGAADREIAAVMHRSIDSIGTYRLKHAIPPGRDAARQEVTA